MSPPTSSINPATSAKPAAPSTPPKKAKGLSLLDDSPVPSSAAISQHPHDTLLQQAARWTSQLESVRDDLMILQMKNAILMDRLVMAGVDVGDDVDEA